MVGTDALVEILTLNDYSVFKTIKKTFKNIRPENESDVDAICRVLN